MKEWSVRDYGGFCAGVTKREAWQQKGWSWRDLQRYRDNSTTQRHKGQEEMRSSWTCQLMCRHATQRSSTHLLRGPGGQLKAGEGSKVTIQVTQAWARIN